MQHTTAREQYEKVLDAIGTLSEYCKNDASNMARLMEGEDGEDLAGLALVLDDAIAFARSLAAQVEREQASREWTVVREQDHRDYGALVAAGVRA